MPRKPASSPAAGRKPIDPMGLRQRARADGSVRVWWEPRAEARKLGFSVVELSAERMSWSRKRAEELNAQVEAARTGTPIQKKPGRAGARSISALISDYKDSPHWKAGIRPKTRDSYSKLLLQIDDKWGVHKAADFDKATMKEWYRTLFTAKGARMAQALIRMMSILMTHAEDLRWRPENSNPCFRLKMVTPDPRSRHGNADELNALLEGARALGWAGMGLAISLAVYQGQRQTDIRQAVRGAFTLMPVAGEPSKAWVWKFVRSKRQNAGMMRVHDAVIPALRIALADTGSTTSPRGPQDPLIYDEATGKPYSEDLFAKRWAKIRSWAADPDQGNCPQISTLQFRDLRRTFGVLARAGGASKDDVGDVLGNSAAVDPVLGETYMPPSFETASRAVAAVHIPKSKPQRKKA